MSLTVRVLFVVTLLLSIVIPFGYFLIGQRTKKRYKRAIGTNIFFFFSSVGWILLLALLQILIVIFRKRLIKIYVFLVTILELASLKKRLT